MILLSILLGASSCLISCAAQPRSGPSLHSSGKESYSVYQRKPTELPPFANRYLLDVRDDKEIAWMHKKKRTVRTTTTVVASTYSY